MAEVNFELYNNQLVQQLVGASDANLRLIEKILNVEISSFGNQINIKGSQDAVDQAKTAIDLLYGKVSKGIEIGEQEVKAAVRMSEEGPEKIDGQNLNDIVLKTKKRHIYPRSATQAKYIQEMMKNELVFGLGPAGTGKTYLAVALAVSMMLEGKIDKIILSRPAVEAGENLGFLPGDLKDKVDPYLRPLYDALYEMLRPNRSTKAGHRRNRNRAAGFHARPHAIQRLCHSRRGTEHNTDADENVSDPSGRKLPHGRQRRPQPG